MVKFNVNAADGMLSQPTSLLGLPSAIISGFAFSADGEHIIITFKNNNLLYSCYIDSKTGLFNSCKYLTNLSYKFWNPSNVAYNPYYGAYFIANYDTSTQKEHITQCDLDSKSELSTCKTITSDISQPGNFYFFSNILPKIILRSPTQSLGAKSFDCTVTLINNTQNALFYSYVAHGNKTCTELDPKNSYFKIPPHSNDHFTFSRGSGWHQDGCAKVFFSSNGKDNDLGYLHFHAHSIDDGLDNSFCAMNMADGQIAYNLDTEKGGGCSQGKSSASCTLADKFSPFLIGEPLVSSGTSSNAQQCVLRADNSGIFTCSPWSPVNGSNTFISMATRKIQLGSLKAFQGLYLIQNSTSAMHKIMNITFSKPSNNVADAGSSAVVKGNDIYLDPTVAAPYKVPFNAPGSMLDQLGMMQVVFDKFVCTYSIVDSLVGPTLNFQSSAKTDQQECLQVEPKITIYNSTYKLAWGE